MLINGIDLDGLAHEAPAKIEIPEMVPGRVCHIDADFLAYQVSYERVDEPPKSMEEMKENAIAAATTLKDLAGAEFLHLHLTPATSDKGKRYDLAIQKEYQGNRIDKPKPRLLHIMRDWMGRHFPATLHQTCEADDGMSSMQYEAIAAGKGHLSIIASKDKDLRMVPGNHLDWDTGVVTGTAPTRNEYGTVWVNEKGKIKGYGQVQFWAQMLTGDTADHIQGLPKCAGYMLNLVKPTAETRKANAIIDSDAPEAKKEKARATLRSRPAGLCGPKLAMEILQRCGSNREAFEVIKLLYKDYGEEFGYVHWKTGLPVEWQKVFVSEAQLLWMRRDKSNPMDVAAWFKEILS